MLLTIRLTKLTSSFLGKPTENNKASGSAPIAATSLRFTTTAL